MCILFQYQIPCQPLGLYKKPALRPRWMSQKWTKSGFCRAGFDCVSGSYFKLGSVAVSLAIEVENTRVICYCVDLLLIVHTSAINCMEGSSLE